MKKNTLLLLILINASLIFSKTSAQESSVSRIINEISYGVPTSPAFELLSGKSSEVVNLLTPQDFASNINNLYDGKKLRTGAAFDFRLTVFSKNLSLRKYQENYGSRLLHRSTISLGTSPDSEIKGDVLLSGGLRISLIDKSDARNNSKFLNDLNQAALSMIVAPVLGLSDEENIGIQEDIAERRNLLQPIRDRFYKDNWNQWKLDVGSAIMLRSKSGALKSDSLSSDKFGLWIAGGIPLYQLGQLTASGKIARTINADLGGQESGRETIGARVRFFLPEKYKYLAISAEGALIKTHYKAKDLNETWTHFGVLVEYHVKKLKGWIGLAYGGDTDHRENKNNKISFNYAFYTNQLIKK